MSADLFFPVLLILLGAMIAYAIDEQFLFTPRLSAWLGKVLDQ